MTNHMMIDLETLGTSDRAVILQIGAAVFDPYGTGATVRQQWTTHIDDSLKLGGKVDGDTVYWWLQQPARSQLSVSSVTHSLTTALKDLDDLYATTRCQTVWSHGATFDVPILGGYYNRSGSRTPWKYVAARDTRTLFEVAAAYGWVKPRVEVAHTAMADAVAQVVDVQSAWQHLKSRLAPTSGTCDAPSVVNA